MNTDKKIILFGAGRIGRRAFDYFGSDRVHCFADNFKHGQEFWGKPVISFEELKEIAQEYDVVVSMYDLNDVLVQLEKAGIKASVFEEHINIDNLKSNPDIAKFHNIHKGKRCFLIGNGPSLRSEDLDRLHTNNEISFGCNLIYKIFPQTPWRPNYFFVADNICLDVFMNEIADIDVKIKFVPYPELCAESDTKTIRNILNTDKGFYNFYYYYKYLKHSKTNCNCFSTDPSKLVSVSGTVMFIMMQFAAYMGFDRIYLLGVDGSSIYFNDKNYFNERRHFYEESNLLEFREKLNVTVSEEAHYLKVNNCYRCAENYSHNHGFRIYNATRGGQIEVFERADFDSLFS